MEITKATYEVPSADITSRISVKAKKDVILTSTSSNRTKISSKIPRPSQTASVTSNLSKPITTPKATKVQICRGTISFAQKADRDVTDVRTVKLASSTIKMKTRLFSSDKPTNIRLSSVTLEYPNNLPKIEKTIPSLPIKRQLAVSGFKATTGISKRHPNKYRAKRTSWTNLSNKAMSLVQSNNTSISQSVGKKTTTKISSETKIQPLISSRGNLSASTSHNDTMYGLLLSASDLRKINKLVREKEKLKINEDFIGEKRIGSENGFSTDKISVTSESFIARKSVKEIEKDSNTGKKSVTGKGSGAGIEYEEEMVGLIALRMCSDLNVADFQICMNHPQVPALDDVIFTYNASEEESIMVYIQLKHKDSNGKKIPKTAFEREKDDYSLFKYFDAYKTIKSRTMIWNGIDRNRERFVIYTNARIDPKECQELKLYGSNTTVRVEENTVKLLHYQKILFSGNKKYTGKIYRFIVTNDDSSEEERDFFTNLFLFVNQSNVSQLRSAVTRNCMKDLLGDCCDRTKVDDAVTKYREYIKHRKNSTVNKPFTKEQILCKVTWLYTKSLHIAPKAIVDANRKNIVNVWNEVTLGKRLIVVSEYNEKYIEFLQHCLENDRARKYLRLNLKHLKLKLIKEYLAVAWKNESISHYQTLFLETEQIIDTDEESLLREAIYVLADKSNYTLIIACNFIDNVIESENVISNIPVLICLKDLKNENVLTKKSLTYYGVSTTLGEISKFSIVKTCFRTHHMLELLLSDLRIGCAENKYISFYVDRKLTVTAVKPSILICKNLERNVICLSGNFEKLKLDRDSYIESSKITDSASLSQYRIINLDTETSKLKEFQRLRKTLHMYDLSCIHIENEEDRTVLRLINSSKDSNAFFQKNLFLYEENITLDANFEINIIIGEPGMGKSVLCDNLQQDEHILLRITHEQLENMHTLDDILKNNMKNDTDLSKEIFKYYCMRRNILLIIDAFDELTEKARENALQMIEDAVTDNYKILITTRPATSTILEERTGVKSQKLKPFGKEEQKTFFVKYWTAALSLSEKNIDKVSEFFFTLLERVQVSINDRENSITGIPLQCRMLAEIYQDYCMEYVDSSRNVQESTKLDILDLYEKYIHKKINIFCSEKMKLKGTAMEVFKDRIIAPDTEKYQVYAILTIFIDMNEIICKYNINTGKEDYEKLYYAGIFTSLEQRTILNTTVLFPVFVHRTYAEYFAALYLSQNWEDEKELIVFILNNRKYDTVRYFFDLLMARGCPLITATIRNDIEQITISSNINEIDNGGRTALHLAAMWGVRVSDFNDGGKYNGCDNTLICKRLMEYNIDNIISKQDDINKWTAIKCADNLRSLHIMNELIGRVFISSEASTLLDDFLHNQFYFQKYGKDSGFTLLHQISVQGFNELLIYIVKHYSEINCENRTCRGKTSLHLAAIEGHWEIVNTLMVAGANVNTVDEFGYTALHYAAQYGHSAVVKLLLNDKCVKENINTKAFNSNTSLHLAVEKGDTETVSTLVMADANLDIIGEIDLSPLQLAVFLGKTDIVKFLLKVKPDIENVDTEGQTLLQQAFDSGNIDTIDWLIRAGANVHIIDRRGWTILHHAARKGYTDIVKLLLSEQFQLNINCVDNSKQTPLHLAAKRGHLDIVKILKTAGANVDAVDLCGYTALSLAVMEGHVNIVIELLPAGANIDTTDKYSYTILHRAVQKGNESAVRKLLKLGANVNICDRNGYTAFHFAAELSDPAIMKILLCQTKFKYDIDSGRLPLLHVAALNGNIDVVNILLRAGANVNVRDKNGYVALHRAAMGGHTDVIRTLISNKCIVDIVDRGGCPSLFWAVIRGFEDIVDILLTAGAQTDSMDNYRWTALHYGAMYGHNSVIHLLLQQQELKQNINCIRLGKTPLHLAAEKGHTDVVNTLIKANAKVDIVDKCGQTALHLAARRNGTDVLKLLLSDEQAKLNINSMDDEERTALHYAVVGQCVPHQKNEECMHEELIRDAVEVLVQNGADVNIKDENNHTPLSTAIIAGHHKIACFLIECESS